jgi:hypothetical protein
MRRRGNRMSPTCRHSPDRCHRFSPDRGPSPPQLLDESGSRLFSAAGLPADPTASPSDDVPFPLSAMAIPVEPVALPGDVSSFPATPVAPAADSAAFLLDPVALPPPLPAVPADPATFPRLPSGNPCPGRDFLRRRSGDAVVDRPSGNYRQATRRVGRAC